MARCKRRSVFLANRDINPSWIDTVCSEYGIYTEDPYPDDYNIGLMSMMSGGIPFDDEDIIVKMFTAGDLGTSKFLRCSKRGHPRYEFGLFRTYGPYCFFNVRCLGH